MNLSIWLNVALVMTLGCAVASLRYLVDDRSVRVVCWGITFRKIALTDIVNISTDAPFWNEHWCNTFWPFGRIVCLRRRTGLFRNFIITPKNRDEFIRDLRQRLGQIA